MTGLLATATGQMACQFHHDWSEAEMRWIGHDIPMVPMQVSRLPRRPNNQAFGLVNFMTRGTGVRLAVKQQHPQRRW